MNRIALLAVALAAVFVFAVTGTHAQPTGGQATLAAPKPKPTFFYSCNSDTKKCTCHGAQNCIKLANSGKCKSEVTNVNDNNGNPTGGQCDWANLTRRPAMALAAAPTPQKYDCYYHDNPSHSFCDCTGTADCKKLSDSKNCTGALEGSGEYKQCPTK